MQHTFKTFPWLKKLVHINSPSSNVLKAYYKNQCNITIKHYAERPSDVVLVHFEPVIILMSTPIWAKNTEMP